MINFNTSGGSGAIDIIVSKKKDNKFYSSDFNVKFSYLQIFYTNNKNVSIRINGKTSKYKMKINHDGFCYFEYMKKSKNKLMKSSSPVKPYHNYSINEMTNSKFNSY